MPYIKQEYRPRLDTHIEALTKEIQQNIGDEFYRRYAAPYEDEQIKKNGDVY